MGCGFSLDLSSAFRELREWVYPLDSIEFTKIVICTVNGELVFER